MCKKSAQCLNNAQGVVQTARDRQQSTVSYVRLRRRGKIEAAVDRVLARAHALNPGVYTHAHRYVPSRWGPEAEAGCSRPHEL